MRILGDLTVLELSQGIPGHTAASSPAWARPCALLPWIVKWLCWTATRRVPVSQVAEMRRHLMLAGVTETTVFADLEGPGREVAYLFTEKPMKGRRA
jgi:hypothetical protein